MNWHEIVGANVRRLRRAQGETQAELATLPASTFEAWVASSVAKAIHL